MSHTIQRVQIFVRQKGPVKDQIAEEGHYYRISERTPRNGPDRVTLKYEYDTRRDTAPV